MREEIAAKLNDLTVDVNTVELADNTLAKYAETAPLPERSPDRIVPMTLSYDANMQVGEQPIEMDVKREVSEAELDGMPVWQIVSSMQSPMGAAADTFYIDKKTLLPLRRSVTRGPAVIKLTYTENKIKGMIKAGPQDIPVDISLSAPVMAEGSALGVTVAALPLAPNYETTVRVFDPLSQKVRPMSLKVTATETVEAKAGSFETYRIKIDPLDGQPGGDILTLVSTTLASWSARNRNYPHKWVAGR